MKNSKYIWLAGILSGALVHGCTKDDAEIPGQNQVINQEIAYPGQKGEVLEVNLNGHIISCEKIDGLMIYQGDIVIDESQLRKSGTLKGAAIKTISDRWPNKTVFYSISQELPDQSRVTDAIEHWEKNTDIEFVERTDQENYLEFIWDAKNCASNLGMIGNRQKIWLADWGDKGSVIHEIGHAVGLLHEHSKPNRDSYVQIHWDEIEEGKGHNFNINEQALQTDGFDFESIMLYSSYGFSIGTNPTITKLDGTTYNAQRKKLSADDIRMVDLLYSWPVAESSISQTTVETDITIEFKDLSSNNPTTWSWDFGDGTTSLEQHPIHSYKKQGLYTVNLTVTNVSGSDKLIRADMITVNPGAGNGSFTDGRDGQVYKWKKLGEQVWMAENLKHDAGSGSWCYNNQSANCAVYGRLYTQAASRQACPFGWHVPSDDEWKELERFLGMDESLLASTGYRGKGQGTMLGMGGASGLDLEFGGSRSSVFSSFSDIDNKAVVWTGSPANATETWIREISRDKFGIGRYKTVNVNGLAIRCIRNNQ